MKKKLLGNYRRALIISGLLLGFVLFLPHKQTEEQRVCPALAFCAYDTLQIKTNNFGAPLGYVTYEKRTETGMVNDKNTHAKSNFDFNVIKFLANLSLWFGLSILIVILDRARGKRRAYTGN